MIYFAVYKFTYLLTNLSLHWNSPVVYPWSRPHQWHRITEVVMSLPSWSFCRLRYRWP